jgi:hypothetical protein
LTAWGESDNIRVVTNIFFSTCKFSLFFTWNFYSHSYLGTGYYISREVGHWSKHSLEVGEQGLVQFTLPSPSWKGCIAILLLTLFQTTWWMGHSRPGLLTLKGWMSSWVMHKCTQPKWGLSLNMFLSIKLKWQLIFPLPKCCYNFPLISLLSFISVW